MVVWRKRILSSYYEDNKNLTCDDWSDGLEIGSGCGGGGDYPLPLCCGSPPLPTLSNIIVKFSTYINFINIISVKLHLYI